MAEMFVVEAVAETIRLLKTIIPPMLVGMLISRLIYSLPQFRKISEKILSRFMNLKSGVAILAFFAHKVVALSILSEMYRKGEIDRNEVIIASIIGLFPMSVRTAMFLFAPLAIPALGFKLGSIFVLLDVTSKFIISLIGVYLGRRYLTGFYDSVAEVTPLKDSIYDALKQFLRVLLVLIPSIFLTTLIIDSFNFISSNASEIAIIVSGTGSSVAGIGVASSLIARNEISGKSALFSLIIAQAFHRIVESLRFSLPLNLSLFGQFGVRLTALILLANELAILFSLLTLIAISEAGII